MGAAIGREKFLVCVEPKIRWAIEADQSHVRLPVARTGGRWRPFSSDDVLPESECYAVRVIRAALIWLPADDDTPASGLLEAPAVLNHWRRSA